MDLKQVIATMQQPPQDPARCLAHRTLPAGGKRGLSPSPPQTSLPASPANPRFHACCAMTANDGEATNA
eukprot:12898424-Prorocentrum_lima.AAC.1